MIYKISNNVNDKIYVGSSKDFSNRVYQHIYDLRKRKHHSILLQRHVDKYGIDSLKFDVITTCEPEKLISTEQFYIDSLEPFFNIRRTAESNLGIKLSDETKAKISKANLGRVVSLEVRNRISKANKGRITSNETKEKLSKQKIGSGNPMFGKTGKEHHNYGKKWKFSTSKISRKVIDLNTNIVYENAKTASEKLNIPFGTFAKYLLNYTKKITNFKYYED